MVAPTIFESCQPREDILRGAVTDADFAADLASVVSGAGSPAYADPARFFANTYPTRGLRNLLANVCRRLSGAGGEAAAIFRLDTSYGGGKTHGLIALVHAAHGMQGVADASEFLDPSLLPTGKVRVAAFDGENADPANGRALGDGVLAYTPWGEIAYALAGAPGYERVRKSDELRAAPGAGTLQELFGGEPTLILLDELSVYLRKVRRLDDARDQLTAFLTSLFKAIENAPNAALVYTLAIGKGDGGAPDAYSEENRFIADQMAEAESVSARKATLLNPTADDETIQVLRRRLFETIDPDAAAEVAGDYRRLWSSHADLLPSSANPSSIAETCAASYPLHPEVLETLTSKTATLATFQRVRGMLRLLARTVGQLWDERPGDATAIHLHHIDPGHEPIRQEILTRLGQDAYAPAIANDIAGPAGRRSLAEEIDAADHSSMPPYAEYAARTIFMHTLAFNEPLKGLAPDRLRYSMLGPALDISFIEEGRKKFVAESAYLDDRPAAPLRFLAEANLSQIIRREEQHVDSGEARAELNDRIRRIFDGPVFDTITFPGGPFDVPDEVGDGRPKLVVISYDAVSVGATVDEVPDLVERIYSRKGAESLSLRALRNHMIFVAAEEARKSNMQDRSRRRLALRELKKPERLGELAEHQQDQVREQHRRSEQELAVAIQQTYRHVFYPSRNRLGSHLVDLAHTAIDMHSSSERPGSGQQHVVRALRDLGKLRLSEDQPDSPAYVRDRTPLKKGQISTGALRDEFRRDPGLAMLSGNDVFIRGIRRGVELGEYVYQRGDLLFGPGDPAPTIEIDEQSMIFTMAYARNELIWPRPSKEEVKPGTPSEIREKPGAVGPSPKPGFAVPAAPAEFSAEGPFSEALLKLWEQARDRGVDALASLTISMFEARDAFPMVNAVNAVAGATKTIRLAGGYETRDGGALELEFSGPPSDAQPVREFLQPQFRDATESTLEAAFRLEFAGGLPLGGDAPEQLANQLTRFAGGAAHVSASAQARPADQPSENDGPDDHGDMA
jgi:hypothetical protein